MSKAGVELPSTRIVLCDTSSGLTIGQRALVAQWLMPWASHTADCDQTSDGTSAVIAMQLQIYPYFELPEPARGTHPNAATLSSRCLHDSISAY